MDGLPTAQLQAMAQRQPDADPLIARVPLKTLFAWLAEAPPAEPPVPVFVAGAVAAPAPRMLSKPVVASVPVPQPQAAPMVAPASYQISAKFSINAGTAPGSARRRRNAAKQAATTPISPEPPPPPAEAAAELAAAEEPEYAAPLPFLPPPLIAPVLRPRPMLSRVDDFLPGRPNPASDSD